MRRAAVFRLASGGASAALAVCLLAALAPVSPASASHVKARPVPAPPSAPGRMALARLMAAERLRPGLGPGSAGPATGVITGFVKSFGGAPFAGICVTAAGPARAVTAASRADGRYVLAGLRPGRYTLRVSACGLAGNRAPISVFWSHAPRGVRVAGGQVRTLPSAFAWRSGQYSQAVEQPAARPVRTGSISGRVTGNGRPLAHICAIAIPAFSYLEKGPQPHGTTSKSGRYRISGLRPGRYLVVFRTGIRSCPADANWLPQWYPYLDSTAPPDNAANVPVLAGRDTARVDGRLRLGGEITGVVRTKAGKPVRGICVDFSTFFVFNGIYTANAASVSRQGGRYALHGLFPGSYQVQFTMGCGNRGDYAPQWWRGKSSPDSADSVKLTGRRTVGGIDAALLPGAAITGTVRARTARAEPIAGICVEASQDLGEGTMAVTGKNGTYRLDGLFGGNVQISFDPACNVQPGGGYLPARRTLTIKAGKTRAGVSAYLRPGAGVTGVIRGPAGEPADPCVNAGDGSAVPDAKGRYLINDLPPGKYTIFFDTSCDSDGSLAPQWYNNRPDDGSASLVTFTAGKVTRVNVSLHPGGTLTGVLRDAKGKPVIGDCVSIQSAQNQLGTGGGAGGDDMTGDDGRYFINDLPPGQYQVSFGCGTAYRFPSVWFRSRPDSSTANFLMIDAGVTTTLNETVGPAGIIKGKVTDKAGRPIPDICVNVASARDGQYVTAVDSGAMTDHGRYQVGQLTPGRYLVQFTDCNAFVYGDQWYHGKTSEFSATPVTVRARQATVGINGVLTVGGTISGRVTGPGGKPASGICVSAFDPAAGPDSGGFGFTGANGRYAVTGLVSGRYRVFFSGCDPRPSNLASITLPKPVRVVAGHATTGVNVRLAAGGTITGTVTGDSAEPGPQNQACVLAVPTNPNGSYPMVWTGASGRYTMGGLAAGTYRVYLGDPFCDNVNGLPALAPQWFSGQPDQPSANLVTVRAGRTTSGISATLGSYGGIEGTVTDRARKGVGGECVTAVPLHATVDPFIGPVSPSIAITQPTGRFRLLDLTAGRYKIEFSTGCGATGFATQWWRSAASAQAAQVITVSHSTITRINATLRR